MKPPPVPPPPEVTVTPPDSLPDDDVQVIVPKPPAYADEARPATWLSDAEQHACQALSSKVSSAIVVADDPERRARALALERPAVKLQKNGEALDNLSVSNVEFGSFAERTFQVSYILSFTPCV